MKNTNILKNIFISVAGTMVAGFLFGTEYISAKAEVLGTAVDTDGNVIYYDVNDVFNPEMQEQALEEQRNNIDELIYCDGMVDVDTMMSEATELLENSDTSNQVLEANEESDSNNFLYSAADGTNYFTDETEASLYIVDRMVEHQTEILIYVTASVYNKYAGDDFAINFMYASLVDRENCASYEGDAIRWIYKGCSYYPNNSTVYNGVMYYRIWLVNLTYQITLDEEAELQEAINDELDMLGIDEMDSEYDKVKAIHDFICDNCDYDYTYKKYTAYDAMIGKSAVCEGYATLFYRMCKEAGLGVRVIDGNPRTDGSSGHAWNIVRIGEYYYDVDSTWDGQDTTTYWTYFLKAEKDFGGHTRATKFSTSEFYAKYPMTETSYSGGTTAAGLNKTNYSYKYTTYSGNTVTTTASGKAKVLIYYEASDNLNSDGSINTTTSSGSSTMTSLAAAYTAGTLSAADYIFIDISASSATGVQTVAEQFGSDSFSYTYDNDITSSSSTDGYGNKVSNSYAQMFRYYYLCGNSGSCYIPMIIYIDSDNKVQYLSMGSATASSINQNLEMYCGVETVSTDVITFVGNSMSIDDTWNLKYYVQLSDTWKADSDALMRFTYGFGTNAKTIDVKVSSLSSDEILESGTSLNGTVLSADTYVFSVGLDAKDIGTTIYAYMVDSDGDCSQVYSYSVKEYAEALLELEDDSDKYADLTSLVKAMLNYGTYSQEYFEYRTNIPANACLDASDKGTVSATRRTAASTWAAAQTTEAGTIVVADDDVRNYLISDLASERADVTGSIEGLTFGGASLILENTTDIRLYLVIDDFLMSDTAENITVTVDGKDKGYLKNLVTSTVMSGCYYITLSDIEATALGDNYVVTFTDGDDSYSISYSAMSYVYAGLSNVSADDKLVNVMESIYEYYKAAVNMESAS